MTDLRELRHDVRRGRRYKLPPSWQVMQFCVTDRSRRRRSCGAEQSRRRHGVVLHVARGAGIRADRGDTNPTWPSGETWLVAV